MSERVLDAWAVMAWLNNQEPAAKRVRTILDAAERRECKLLLSIVNLGEIFYLSAKERDFAYGQYILENVRARVTTVPADDDLVLFAASLKARHRISYADAFAAATALFRDAPLVTGDPEFRVMAAKEPKLKLEWIGG